MCLAIPAKIVEVFPGGPDLALVEVGGVRRRIDTGLLQDEDAPKAGDWVLIHVGFAMSKVSEEDALDQTPHAHATGRNGRCLRRSAKLRRSSRLRSKRLMKFVDEFRAPEVIGKASEEIRRLADPQRQYRFMEVCGGHTHAIYRFGIKDLLPVQHRAGARPRLPGMRACRWEESTMAFRSRRTPTSSSPRSAT